jgi:RNA polymerase sigma-70 factor (ECF subfamily)
MRATPDKEHAMHVGLPPPADYRLPDGTRPAPGSTAHDLTDLYCRFYGTTYAAALLVLNDHDTAQDAAHAVFERLLRRSDDVKDLTLNRRYFAVAGRNEALKIRDAYVRRDSLAASAGPPAMPRVPDLVFERSELRRDVLEAVSTLPPRCQQFAELCLLEGKTQQEAADEAGVSSKAVQKQIARAKRHLRKRLAHGWAPSATVR